MVSELCNAMVPKALGCDGFGDCWLADSKGRDLEDMWDVFYITLQPVKIVNKFIGNCGDMTCFSCLQYGNSNFLELPGQYHNHSASNCGG